MPTFHFLEFPEFSNLCLQLASKIKKDTADKPLDYIISIQRGGALMSKILSDLLNVPIATLTISTYENLRQVKEPFVSQEVSVSVSGKNVLVVDEISDSGVTLHFVEEYLSKQAPSSLKTAVLFTKSHSKFSPDYWVEQSDKWIVFPGELRETAEAIASLPNLDATVHEQFKAYAKSQGATEELLRELEIKNK